MEKNIQLLICILYFGLTLVVGLIASFRMQGSAAYHGTQLGITAIVCASCGEWLGGTATTGVSEYGFLYGISGAWYTIANALGIFLLGILFASLYRSIGSITVPGIMEYFFGAEARTVSSVLLIIVMLAVGVSQMVAAGKLGEGILGVDFTHSCLIFAVIFIVYTMVGGMKAITSTNRMHLIVMYVGVILGAVLAIGKVGGFSRLFSMLKVVDAHEGTDHFGMFSIGMPKVSSWIIASILGAGTAQAGLQPVLVAKDTASAKKSCLLTACAVAPFGFFTVLMGMAAKALSGSGQLIGIAGENITEAKLGFSTLLLQLPGLAGGLILASVLAALLSTASPIILASATLFTKDIYQRKLKPNSTDEEIVRVSKVMTVASGIFCCVCAIALVDATTVLDLVYSAYSLRGAIFIVLLCGICGWKLSGKVACHSMIASSIVMLLWVGYKMIYNVYPLSIGGFAITETYVGMMTAVAICVLGRLFIKKNVNNGKETV